MVATAVPTIVPTIVSQDMAGIGVKARFADGAYTGASACSVDYGGVWTDFAGGTPPIVTVAGKKYLQMETARENILTQVRALDHVDWPKTRATVTANNTNAPDGNATADKIVEDTTAANTHLTSHSIAEVVNGTKYSVSAYAKAAERTQIRIVNHSWGIGGLIDCDLELGEIIASSAVEETGMNPVYNSWFRCWFTKTAYETRNTIEYLELMVSGSATYNGDGSSGNYCWNPQFEIGDYPSSPINSEAVATTRAKDEFVWLEADVPSALRGKISINWIPYWGSDSLIDVTFVEYDESGASDNIRVWYDATDQKIYVDDETGVATKVTSDALTITRFDVIKITLNPAAGSITVSGATGGNGTNVGTAWSTSAGDVYFGGNESGGEQIEGLISEPY